jgi:hypothetical protein
MERVKEYLNQIKVPFEEEQAEDMTVLKLKYCEDLLAIFPPDDGEEEFHVVSAYGGKVRQYTKMSFEKLKQWLYDVFIKQSPDYVYVDEPAQENKEND